MGMQYSFDMGESPLFPGPPGTSLEFQGHGARFDENANRVQDRRQAGGPR
jgi:hypothetical protein